MREAFVGPVGPIARGLPGGAAAASKATVRPQRWRAPVRAVASPPNPAQAPALDESAEVKPAAPLNGFNPWEVYTVVSPEQFDSLLADVPVDSLVIVNFHASWCRKCIYLLPKFRKMAASYAIQGDAAPVYFATCDVNKVATIPRRQGVSQMPTFHFYQGQTKVDEIIGSGKGPEVIEMLKKSVAAVVCAK